MAYYIDPDDCIQLGHAEIDMQHAQMFVLAEAVIRTRVGAGKPKVQSDTGRAIQALIDFALWHFHFEEALMMSAGYPEAARHEQEHSRLLEKLANHRYRVDIGRRNTAHLSSFLRDWITKHIGSEDRSLVFWIKSRTPLGEDKADGDSKTIGSVVPLRK